MDSLDSTHTFYPLQGFVHYEDGENRRGVEHRLLVDVGAVIQHSRDVTGNLSQGILSDDGENDACRARILLRSTINHCVLGYIYRTAENV